MKVHDLKPAPGSKRPKRRVGRGIGGKGGKTAGRGTKGQGARGTVSARFEGGQTPLHRRTPKAKGFNNPFRIEYHVVNLTRSRRSTPAPRSHPTRCAPRASSPSGAWSRCSAGANSPSRSRSGRTGSRGRRSGRSRLRAGRPRCCRCRGRPDVRRPEGTPSPTARYTAGIPNRQEVVAPMSGLSRLRNMFRVPDLRNKIFFTIFIIFIFRLGSHIPVPYVDFQADPGAEEGAENGSGGAVGFLDLFSGGALTSCAVFFLGIMPYITASIIMQLLGVVIPKLEQWQQEGQTGQKKITQWTRYLTVRARAHAVDALVFVMKSGNGGLLGQSGLSLPPGHDADHPIHAVAAPR